jgi:oligopeptide/dipeptide ABC transporter ATP-binding protein
MRAEAPWVEVDGLRVAAAGGNAIVKDVSFAIARGEVVALIGESGSGKTTIGLALMGYVRPGCQLAAGRVRIGATDVRALARPELPSFRGRSATYIAQSAAAAFNPARRLMPQVIESALIHKLMSRAEAEAKARALFAALALPDPEHIGDRFPHQVSGGQLQRLLAAMALITEPELVIFDEPTTALDVTTQIEVLRAFKNVMRQRRTTALYVSHDLAVVAQMADHIIVLRDGAVQEAAPTVQLLAAPSHPYTRSLLAAVAPVVCTGEVASAPVPPPRLRIRGLTAGYGDLDAGGVTVLRDIELSIETESVLGVIGESGCDKSTLAQVIAGLLQRVNLARALAAEPSLILCDEVTSALDSVVGAAILDLLTELRRELGLSYMFISHDLTTVRAICDKVLILYGGQMVELGGRDAMRRRPMHPYTDLLLSSVPELRTGWLDSISATHLAEASGGVAFHAATQPCTFFGRCAQRLPGVCNAEPPPLRSLSKGAVIRCHRGEQELLRAQAMREPHEDFVP